MKQATIFLLLLTVLPSISLAEVVTVIGGDNIGSDNSTVNGNGAEGAHADTSFNPSTTLALPAIPFAADGRSKLHDFRMIATVIEFPLNNGATSHVNWSQHNWVFAIWTDDGFKNEQRPIAWHRFGATPDNWSGFNVISNRLTVPDTTPFGNFGNTGDFQQDLYEVKFAFGEDGERFKDPVRADNRADELFVNPLPEGDYFFGAFSATDQASWGQAGIAITRSDTGPEYWYDYNVGEDGMTPVPPRPVYPDIVSDPSIGVAFSVRVTSVPEPSSVYLLGLVGTVICLRRKKRMS